MQKSNFIFLSSTWPELAEELASAELQARTAPRAAAIECRLGLELAVNWLYENDRALTRPYQDNLHSLLMNADFLHLVPVQLLQGLNYVRHLGNSAAHQKAAPTPQEILQALRHLHSFLGWMAMAYSPEKVKVTVFDESLLSTIPIQDKSRDEALKLLQKKEEEFEEILRKKELLLEQSEVARKQLEARLLEVESIKERNLQLIPEPEPAYSETETRTQFIDLLLREAGWDPQAPNATEFKVQGMPSKSGIGYVDYVLWGEDGLPLAVVEAKHTLHDARKGQHQAKLYADCLEKRYNRRPFIFFTNGFETWFWDDTEYPPRPVAGFYSLDNLNRLINRRNSKKPLKSVALDKNIAGRYYQEQAIKLVSEGLDNKNRAALLVMATGTGKTRVSAALVDVLMRAGWVTRVLFLADRNALVKQAKKVFNQQLPQLTTINLSEDKEESSTARLVFATYPTMMNRIDGARTGDNRFYGVGHFDLIIIDEAHRSVYQKYQAIFKYFDALLIGLTATPKTDIDRNTYELFGKEDYNPTFAYELDRAVKDGFLVPPKSITVPIKFQREGIKYKELSEKEKEEYEQTFRDEATEVVPDQIQASALHDWLFNKNTVDQVLSYLMTHGIKVEGGDRLGKTIIFAKNHRHALFIQDRFNVLYPHYAGCFLQVIDNAIEKAPDLIEKFSIKDSDPHIAVSVDMLDTGIDIPEIVNLVFFKQVRSYAKFWQMIGRGTRLCPDLFAPGKDKTHFTIFDFCGNFEFFDVFPEGLKSTVQEGLSQKIFKTRLRLAEAFREGHFQEPEYENWRNSLLTRLHKQVSSLSRDNFEVGMKLRYVDTFSKRTRWNNLKKTDIIDIENEIAPLILPEDDDELARRFDLQILTLELAVAIGKNIPQGPKEQVRKMAEGLSRLMNLPAVAAHKKLIQEASQESFWQNAGLVDYEKIRLELRELVKLLDKEERKIVYTNFQDQLGEAAEREMVFIPNTKENYRHNLEKYIRENRHHITIQKLQSNMPITSADLEELERLLFNGAERGSVEDFKKEVGSDTPLGTFIRSIVGLDSKAAKEAFSEFLSKGTLDAKQIEFINKIINYLSQNGTIDKAMLVDRPFTDINVEGVYGVFPGEDVSRIINILDRIDRNARVA